MSREEELRTLSQRTRSLLEDLDGTRQDVLSVADLNRALRQVLKNQVAILDSLVGDQGDPNARTTAQPRAAVNGTSPRITLRQKDAEQATEAPASSRPPLTDDEPDDPKKRDLTGVDRLETGELKQMLGPLGEVPDQPELQQGSLALRVLNEDRELASYEARSFVEAFDNRDKDYAKGLEKLNRWVNGGQSGTPFQWRGDRAYLNLNGAAAEGVRRYEQQLMKRMGFSRRLGRLVVPDLKGDIVVYERP